MKRLLAYLLLCTLLLLMAAVMDAQAQKRSKTPPENGYWVLESNLHTPDTTIAWLYNNDHVLVYKEKMEGIRLNLKKRKTVRQLNAVLVQAVAAWENEKVVRENGHLLASRLR